MSPVKEVEHATAAILEVEKNAERHGWQRVERDFRSPTRGRDGFQVDVYEKGGKREATLVKIRSSVDRRKRKRDFVSGPEEFLEGLGNSRE